MSGRELSDEWIHLGLGATADPQPPFDGMDWYERYSERVADDGIEGRLVAQFRFSENWKMWEMHPNGAEVVICTAGKLTLIQEIGGNERCTELKAGQYAINPAGVWHTADVEGDCEAIFITAGIGTEHRPR